MMSETIPAIQRMFLASIWCLFLLSSLKIGLGVYLIYKYYKNHDDFMAEVTKVFQSISRKSIIFD